MKTKIISKLKKELLLVELPEEKTISTLIDLEITYGYTLLGKPDEISKEDAVKLVDISFDTPRMYKDYKNNLPGFTATESLLSAIEIEIYWENPLNNKLDKSKPLIIQTEHLNKWKEAQEKTFDKNRTLIFVKN